MIKDLRKYLKAPFPYFGGKSAIADKVWEYFWDIKHYIEPFCGSIAVLLKNPKCGEGLVETVNDKDGNIANVWRSIQKDPDKVAYYCDYPVNHIDLEARRRYLIKHYDSLVEKMLDDPDYYDAQIAGYYIWAMSCSIGGDLAERLGKNKRNSPATERNTSAGGLPHISHRGRGVHAKSDLYTELLEKEQAATGGIPHLTDRGRGVHATLSLPEVESDLVNSKDLLSRPYNQKIYVWLRLLAERLRYVRVVCGEWHRVCGGNWQDKLGNVGIFFDPPYSYEDRDDGLYHIDSKKVAHDVRKWCIERGSIPTYRIILAGYAPEHEELLKYGWSTYTYSVNGGYSNQAKKQKNNNKHLETLFISPHCKPKSAMLQLF
jgi:hypothetical protein